MPNCPNCGAEVKEGFKFCLGCGAQIQAGTAQAPPATQPQQTTPPPAQQPPQQMYATVPPKKSNTKLIIGVVVAIIAIVVVVLAVVLFMGGGLGGDSDLVGTWQYTDESTGSPVTAVYVFNSDGTFEAGMVGYTMPMGTWTADGSQFCLTLDVFGQEQEQCFSYSINGNEMTWSQSGIGTIVLTKTS